MHVVRRREQRRQRQHQDQDRGGEESEHRRADDDAGTGQHHDADRPPRARPRRTRHAARSRAPACPATASSSKRGRNLPDIERGQRRADQVGAPEMVQIVGQERIGGEIHRVGAAERDAEPPDQRIAPVRPPALRRLLRRRGRRAARAAADDERDQRDRHGPHHEACAPAIVEQRQHARGMVSATGRISPTSSPLVNTAVPKPMRCGSQVRTSGGSEGCMMATPKPVTIVAA